MFYRIRYVINSKKTPKNTLYKITNSEPRNYDTHEVMSQGLLGDKKGTLAFAEGAYDTFDLAARDIPDEYEDDGNGEFSDPRPVVDVSTWLQEDLNDIREMSESVIETFIIEKEEEADVEGVILTGDMKAYVMSLRSGKK